MKEILRKSNLTKNQKIAGSKPVIVAKQCMQTKQTLSTNTLHFVLCKGHHNATKNERLSE